MTIGDLTLFGMIALFMLLVVLGVIAFQLIYQVQMLDGNTWQRVVTPTLFVLCYLMIQILAEVDSDIFKLNHSIRKTRLGIFIALMLLIMILEFFINQQVKRMYSLNLSFNAIKESMDNLPLGICFSKRDGLSMLVNKKMNELSQALTGRIYLNIQDLKGQILFGDLPEHVELIRSAPVIIIKIKYNYWEIETIDHDHILETQARDVTREIVLLTEIKENN